MFNQRLLLIASLLLSFTAFGNTITIATSASSASGWSYSAGVITASANVTINNATINTYLVSGDLSIVAGTDIIINGDVNPSLGAGIRHTLTLKANGNIVLEASRTVSCATGSIDIIVWSDADENNGGYIYAKSTSVINSQGGHIWMGGGDGTATWNGLTVGDGFARGSTTNIITSAELNSGANSSGFRNGITLYNNSISSGGGNIAISGQGAALTNAYGYMGVYMGYNATISSGAGNIDIDARTDGASSATSTGWFYGILMIPTNNTNNAYGTASIEAVSGNITINASARHNQNISHNAGLAMFTQHATATARVMTQSGSITITGSNLNTSNPSYGGIFLTGAGSENIISRTGNITLRGNSSNAAVSGINANTASRIGYDGSNAYNGNIYLQADNISLSNTAAAVQSTGDLQIEPITSSRAINAGATGGLALPAALFTSNFVNGFSSIRIGSGSYTGNITLGAITFQDKIVFETTGQVTQTGQISASGQELSFQGTGGAYTLTNTANAAGIISANTGSVQYVNNAALQLSNISVSGKVSAATLAGDLDIAGNITSASTATDAILLYADFNKAANDATGGNILITGSPVISTGAGGRASLYSGSVAGSTGLVSLVGGTSNVRMEVDASTTAFTPVLATGVYALFRANASTLPVRLIRFDVRCDGGQSILYWTTATEEGNAGFYIEKSVDLREWNAIYFVNSAGDNYSTQTYQYTDPVAALPTAYYRLKQIDRSGHFTYSKVVSALCGRQENDLVNVQAYPNPAAGMVWLKGLQPDATTRFAVYNMQGVMMQSGTLAGSSRPVDLSGYKPGLYLLKLNSGTAQRYVQVIKQ